MYMPAIKKARIVGAYRIGAYLAMLYTDCQSVGLIGYKYVMLVFDPTASKEKGNSPVVLAVASERNHMMDNMPDAPKNAYFLGVFPGGGHMNLGMSEEWGLLEPFTQRALKVVAEHLHVLEAPILLPPPPRPPWWQFWKR